MLRALTTIAFLVLPAAALAVGGGDSKPPKPTKTTTECKDSEVWDEKTKTCINAQSGMIDDDRLYQAARELAWAGRPEDALVVLGAMTEGKTDRVLTYLGFANRKAGRVAEGMAYYRQALALNPDNLLARSYMGQALVEQDEYELAEAELEEIVARGGAGTWPETALRQAIEDGETYSY